MASNIAKYATQASDVLNQVDKSAEAIKKQYEDLKAKHGKDIQSAMDSGKNFLSSIRSSFKKAPEAVSNENSIYPFNSYDSYNSPYNSPYNSKSIKRIIEQSPLSNPNLYQYSSLNPLLSQYPLSSSLSPLYEQSFYSSPYSSPYSLLDNEYSDIARFYPSSYNLSPVRRSPRRKSRRSPRRKSQTKSKRSQRK